MQETRNKKDVLCSNMAWQRPKHPKVLYPVIIVDCNISPYLTCEEDVARRIDLKSIYHLDLFFIVDIHRYPSGKGTLSCFLADVSSAPAITRDLTIRVDQQHLSGLFWNMKIWFCMELTGRCMDGTELGRFFWMDQLDRHIYYIYTYTSVHGWIDGWIFSWLAPTQMDM